MLEWYDNIYKYIEEYDLNKKRKIYFPFFIQIIFFNQYIMIVFDDMIADMLSNKKPNLIVTELIIRRRKLNISLIFITQSYFAVPKNIRLNSTHYIIMKIQINGSFNSLHLIIHQILTLKTLLIFTKMYCETIFLFSDCYYSCIR